MQQLAAKISNIAIQAERMDRFVRLLLQEQAKLEDEIALLQAEKIKWESEKAAFKAKTATIDSEKWAGLQAERIYPSPATSRLSARSTA